MGHDEMGGLRVNYCYQNNSQGYRPETILDEITGKGEKWVTKYEGGGGRRGGEELNSF